MASLNCHVKNHPKNQPTRERAKKMILIHETFKIKDGINVSSRDYYISCIRRSDYSGVSREWLNKICDIHSKRLMCYECRLNCPILFPIKGAEKFYKFRHTKSHVKQR